MNRTYTHMYWQVALFSGNTNNGVNDGAFYWNLNNTSSNLNQNIGTHVGLLVSKMREVLRVYVPCLLAKETASSLSIGRPFLTNFSKILRIT